jgi:acyl-coenzyme A thioesterase PaaI-like protein
LAADSIWGRIRVFHPSPAFEGKSVLEFSRPSFAANCRGPPIDRLLGIHLLEVETGRAVFAMPAGGWLSQEYGTAFGAPTPC